MQALVRVQARVRAGRVRMSIEGQAVQNMLNERRTQPELLKEAEEGWCDQRGTLQEVKAKIQMRQEGAFKRERALAYGLAQKQWKSSHGLDSKTSVSSTSLKNQQFDKNTWGWSWLERWMSAKPWDNRLMEQGQNDPLETPPPPSKNHVDTHKVMSAKSSEPEMVKVKRNNMTTRISAKPPQIAAQRTRSSSSPSSEYRYDGSSVYRINNRYLALQAGTLLDKSDVFSFGVMLLEIVTGRKPIDPTTEYMDESLVEWARQLIAKAKEDGYDSELVDPRLKDNYDHNEMPLMASCASAAIHHSDKRRPKMSQLEEEDVTGTPVASKKKKVEAEEAPVEGETTEKKKKKRRKRPRVR